MTWQLEADVDGPLYAGDSLATGFLGAIVDDLGGDLGKVRVVRWTGEDETVSDAVVDVDPANPRAALAEIAPPTAEQSLRVQLQLVGAGSEAVPQPQIELFGRYAVGRAMHRRRSRGVIGFGEREGWRKRGALRSGRVLDDDTVHALLLAVARQPEVDAVRLVDALGVSVPINDHFVYHATLDGFLQDLRDLVRIVLHGGGGFGDARDDYTPLVGDPDSPLLAQRHGEWRRAFYDAFVDRIVEIEQRGVPADMREGWLGDAVRGLDDVGFERIGDGCAVFGRPLLGNQVDTFWLGLIDAIVAG